MSSNRQICRAFACLSFTFSLVSAQSNTPAEPQPVSPAAAWGGSVFDNPLSWLDQLWNLPVFRFFTPVDPLPEAPQLAEDTPLPVGPQCSVEPLPEIEDPAAQAFEANVGSAAVVDLSGLTPATAKALTRFQTRVEAVGGVIELKSAYRPASYQQHLQAVWHKWMDELRFNQDPACQTLRSSVQDEFTRHRLLESQHPVAFSDHTRGLAFDALVTLPRGRRKLTLDRLAWVAGVRRPDILHDPVHFKLRG